VLQPPPGLHRTAGPYIRVNALAVHSRFAIPDWWKGSEMRLPTHDELIWGLAYGLWILLTGASFILIPLLYLTVKPLIKRLLLVLGATLALASIIFAGGSAILIHAFTSMDPFPPFVADYASGSYATFDQFVMQRFPVGSNVQVAIAKIGLEGFRRGASKPGWYNFTWYRHTGICNEIYSIDLRESSDGTIAEISGSHPRTTASRERGPMPSEHNGLHDLSKAGKTMARTSLLIVLSCVGFPAVSQSRSRAVTDEPAALL
jgi:hypothetical protein